MTIKQFLSNYNYNISEEYPLKIVGITGSTGKTSVAYIIYKYLQECGKKVSLHSSALVDIDDKEILSRENEYLIHTKEELAEIIFKCYERQSEYLILECHFLPLEAGLFDDIPFSVRTITNTAINSFAGDMDDEVYFASKRKLVENQNGGAVLLNLYDDAFDYYNSGYSADEIYYFDQVSWGDYQEFYDERRKPKGRPMPLYYINSTRKGLKSSFVKMVINGRTVETWVNLSMEFGAVNTLHAAAVLDILGEFTIDNFTDFIEDFSGIPGRGEVFSLPGNKYVILDTGNFDLVVILKEWIGCKFDKFYEEAKEFIPHMDRLGGIDIKTVKVIAPLIVTNKEGLESTRNLFPNSTILATGQRETAAPKTTNLSKLNNLADYAYFAPISPGSINMDAFFDVYKQKINIPYKYFNNRFNAIDSAIRELKDNEVLVISGRGRRSFYREDSVKYRSDYTQILETLNTLEMEDEQDEVL